jgi:HEAT repeat protein
MAPRPYALLLDVLLLPVLLSLPAAAQEAAPVPPPELTAAKAAALEREIAKLRNNHDPGRAKAEAEVIAYGRGAVPLLVKAGHSTHEGQRRGLVTCLLAVTTDDDRLLVGELLASPHIALRRFAARKAGELRRQELMEPLRPLLADADEAVRVEAAIALVSNGHEEGLPVAAPAMAGPLRERVQAALKGVAGKGRHDNVGAMLAIDPQREREEPDVTSKERLAAVDLLHAIGDQTSIDWLVKALDDSHNVVQRNAINALRDLLEQSGPMQGSSVFQQIKEAERIREVAKQKRR